MIRGIMRGRSEYKVNIIENDVKGGRSRRKRKSSSRAKKQTNWGRGGEGNDVPLSTKHITTTTHDRQREKRK